MKSSKRAPQSPVASPDALPPEVRTGQSVELLKQLHILTREGKLNQDSRRKLKQVYHLFQFIEKLLLELPTSSQGPTLADHGAGKSYLGFIIYDLFFKALGQGTIYGIETRSELVESSKALAERLHFERMRFLNVSVAESTQSAELPEQIDVVTAIPRPTTPSPLACRRGRSTWCWCLAARLNWLGRSTRTRP
jgi:Methyltransferase domain